MRTNMQHRCALLIAVFLLHVAAAEVAEPLALIGFHEGARRVVECKDGFITGVEVGYIEDAWSFAEPFIGSIRLFCSNKTMSMEYTGDAEDTFVFGRLGLKTYRKAACNSTLGVAGFKWRAAAIKNPDGAEKRQAGLTVLCNRLDNAPSEMVLEHSMGGPAKTHSGQFGCKQVAKYAGLPAPRLSKVQVWFNRKSLAGLEPLQCV